MLFGLQYIEIESMKYTVSSVESLLGHSFV